MEDDQTYDVVRDYYGKVLANSKDLKTNACVCCERPPDHILNAIKEVPSEVRACPRSNVTVRRLLRLPCASSRPRPRTPTPPRQLPIPSSELSPDHVAEIGVGSRTRQVDEKFYGCGAPLPCGVAGVRVLDLGSGSGRDCYVMSKFVGENGSVIGVDMTEEQLAVARDHTAEFTTKLGCVSRRGWPATGPDLQFERCRIATTRV